MSPLALDRMALDDVGYNPQRLAEAIHAQSGDIPGPVPVNDIARALDIVEIREASLTGFEGALVALPEKGCGAILINSRSSRQRRRFTIGHELAHFLIPFHKPTAPEGFFCSKEDMIAANDSSKHLRQESQANAFAIELLTPRKKLLRLLSRPAGIEPILDIASEFDISREAAARRYVDLHEENLAVVFSSNGSARYPKLGANFPPLCLRAGDRMPPLTHPQRGRSFSQMVEAEIGDWLSRPSDIDLYVQALYQSEGYGIALLIAEERCEEDGE